MIAFLVCISGVGLVFYYENFLLLNEFKRIDPATTDLGGSLKSGLHMQEKSICTWSSWSGRSEAPSATIPRVDASWGVIAADALCCSGSADFPVVFPRELRFSRFFPWELRREHEKPLSLTEISLNYFPPDNQPLSVESAPGRGRSAHGEVLRADACPPSHRACCRLSRLVCDGAGKPRPAIPCG